MPNEPVDPQSMLHSALPVGASLIVVFIPSVDRDGVDVDQDYWVDEVLTTLGQLFRGATAYPRGRGVWRDDERGGVLVREEPVIVFSYANPVAVTSAALTHVYLTLSRMGQATNQGEVGAIIDGKYFGITDYFAG